MSRKCTNHRDDKYGGSLDSNVNRLLEFKNNEW